MSDEKLNYLGPYPKALPGRAKTVPLWRRLPLGFLIVVVIPTLAASIYFLGMATPRYVSEARFIVRAPTQNVPSSLGMALQGVGISSGSTDSFVVHQYISSRDGLRELSQRHDVAAMLGRADIFSRYPRPWESRSDEGLYRAFQRYLTVGFDATTGLSTLRIEAFSARDAQAMAETLLIGGEALVNRLNERATTDAVSEAQRAQGQARTRVAEAQQQITAFRNREAFIDPTLAAREGSQLIGTLRGAVAELRAERSQLASEAPNSPQLPLIDSRIAALNAQIEQERSSIAGTSGSLAPNIGTYEDLVRQREFAEEELAAATTALLTAEQEAQRQALYLERVVSPSLPDEPALPRRWMEILKIFASCMLVYGLGWLVWTGVREHRQA